MPKNHLQVQVVFLGHSSIRTHGKRDVQVVEKFFDVLRRRFFYNFIWVDLMSCYYNKGYDI